MKKIILLLALFCSPVWAQTGTATSSPATLNNGQQAYPSYDLSNNMRVNCVTGCGSSGGASNVNIIQVGGNAVTTSVPVSSIAPTDAYPTGGTITTQDIASTTVQGQFNQNQTTGTPTANSMVSFAVAGYTTFSFGITGTWTGTQTVEASAAPAGVTPSTIWTNKTCRVPGSTLSASTFTSNASDLICNIAGYTNVRIRATAAMTGTATIGAVSASVNLHAIDLINPAKIVDGSGTSNTLTIKAASTAPLATDTAAVVSLSPNSAATSTNGVNGTSAATQANPFPTSVDGVNGTGIATLTNPLSVSEPDGGATIAPIAANGSGTLTSAAVLFSLDTSGYNGISVQVTSPGTTCTITYEQSNDNSTWNSLVGQRSDLASSVVSSSTSAAVIYFETGSRYFRARISTYTSGTVTAGYSLRRSPMFNLASVSIAAGSVALAASTTGGYSFTNISTNATTTAKSGAGTLHTITVNNPGTTETLTIYDNTAGSGTKIGTVAVGTNLTTLIFDLAFSTGLTIVSAGTTTGDWTATWK